MERFAPHTTPAICVIDNTNTQHWEYEKYVEAAKENGFMVQIISVDWKQRTHSSYAERNSHGVPEEAIQRMADRWNTKIVVPIEKTWTVVLVKFLSL